MMFRNGKSRLTLEGIVSSLNIKHFKNDSEYKIKFFEGNVCENGTEEQALLSSHTNP